MAAGSHWQRWTIDELGDLGARVLIAGARHALESTAAEALDAGNKEGIRSAVLMVEDAPPADLWDEERDAILEVALLEPFVRLREAIEGLPPVRPLREGDVFWVVLPVTDEPSSLNDLTPAEVLASAEVLGLQLVDVTAAARQTVKVIDDRVARTATDPRAGA